MTTDTDNGDPNPGTITRLLSNYEHGDSAALEALFPIIYDELHELARRHRRRWSGDTTLDTTALVHEAYLKLSGGAQIGARSRVHFLRLASRVMRQLLANYSRDRRTAKRGGALVHFRIDHLVDGDLAAETPQDRSLVLTALDESLRALEAADRRLYEVVECRFFGGLTVEETATAIDVSAATVKRDWTLARAWLFRDLETRLGVHEP
ncbi:MAG TPA: ECF-type sigma factor [Gemmatimonadaceae bacterium]